MLVGAAVAKEASGAGRTLIALGGLVSIGIGVALVAWPKITIGAVIILIGAWWLVTGLLQTIDGLMNRQMGSRTWAIVSGVISVIAGLILLFNPEIGLWALVFVVALFSLIIGAMNVVISFTLKGTDMTVSVDDQGNVTGPQKV